MAFDDIVRVAALKASASRWQRVRREVAVRDDEVFRLYDHFKPGVPEFAALLPQGLADRLQAWDARRRARGQAPWALPLKIGTHTVAGMLALQPDELRTVAPDDPELALAEGTFYETLVWTGAPPPDFSWNGRSRSRARSNERASIRASTRCANWVVC